jgi:hypothetical protein
MPKPRKGEKEQKFVSRFMSSGEAINSFPEAKQRAAVAYSEFTRRPKKRKG